MQLRTAFITGLFVLFSSTVFASGFLVIKDKREELPVEVDSVNIHVSVSGLTARIQVEEVFRNNTNRNLEGTFMFPVPKGSAVSHFTMSMDGEIAIAPTIKKRIKGNLIDASEAATIYRGIVSRRKDPGLLEYIGCGLYRFSVFPIPPKGTKKITFEYTLSLNSKSDSAILTVPLKSSGLLGKPIKALTFSADIEMNECISNISSTTHNFNVDYKNTKNASVRMFRTNILPACDLEVLIQFSDKKINNTFMTFCGDDGWDYFCTELSTGRIFKSESIQSKDVTYMLDISGSMEGDRIKAAVNALVGSVSLLNPSDRFRLVVFESNACFGVRHFTDVSEKSVKKFRDTIKNIRAMGGTNMEAALLLGLPRREKERLHYVALISDGYPGPGLTNEKKLTDMVCKLKDDKTRLFTIGIGEGVNQFLMDQLALAGGGCSEFISRESSITPHIMSFMKKINFPVYEDVTISFSGPVIQGLAPEKFGAIFAGEPVRIFGRMRGQEPLTVTLSGNYLGEQENMLFSFSSGDAVLNPHLPVLWASRRVASLLDKIQLEGETVLKDEVVRLAARHGLVTPYSSYLITDNNEVSESARQFVNWWNSRQGTASSQANPNPVRDRFTTSDIWGHGDRFIHADKWGRKPDYVYNYLVFILDISGSMKGKVGGSGKWANCSKIDYAREELKKYIKSMPEDVHFNIVAFNSNVKKWAPRLARAKPENKSLAIAFLDSLVPEGETYMNKAFEEAFKDEGAEAMVLISDGAPHEEGKPVEPNVVLDRVELLNTFQMAWIYTVGFTGAQFELMQSLANRHGGKFHFVGDMKVQVSTSKPDRRLPLSAFGNEPEVRLVRRYLKRFSATALRNMLKLAMATQDVNTIRAVKTVLSTLDTEKAREILCKELASTSNYKWRIMLAEALGSYNRCPKVEVALIEAAKREKLLHAMRAEVAALCRFRTKKTIGGFGQIWLAIQKHKELSSVITIIKHAIRDMAGVDGFMVAEDFLNWWSAAETAFMLPSVCGKAEASGQQFLSKLRKADTVEDTSFGGNVIHIGDKTFIHKDNTWVDTRYEKGNEVREIKFLSEEYWKLLRDEMMGRFLSLGPSVLVCLDEETIKIVEKNK